MSWATSVTIADRIISEAHPAYFIADIAANHDGDLGRARDLIWRAKEAGADCAKFQQFLAGKIVSKFGFDSLNSPMAHQAGWKKSVDEVYDQYHTRRDWTEVLVETCRAADIEYMTTPYDLEALAEQTPHVHAVKVGSGDITWHAFLAACAGQGSCCPRGPPTWRRSRAPSTSCWRATPISSSCSATPTSPARRRTSAT